MQVLHSPNDELVIKSTTSKGLFMEAAKDIRKGTVILTEAPFIWFVRPDRENDICRLCAASKSNGHCYDCGDLANIQPFDEYMETLLKRSWAEADDYQKNLVNRLRAKKNYAQGTGAVVELANKVFANTYDILDKYGKVALSALYPTICSINHSCQPNVTFQRLHTLERDLVASRDIDKGEEIFISYFPHEKPWELSTEERRAKFHSIYDVVCQCEWCNRCDNCKIPVIGSGIKRCGRCRNAAYCSKECQVADWKRHRYLCSQHSVVKV